MPKPYNIVAVVGGGKMAVSIVSFLLETAGREIIWIARNDQSVARLNKKLKRIRRSLEIQSDVEVIIDTNFTLLEKADLIIETVVEDELVKKEILRKCAACSRDETLIATNSSSYVPTDLVQDKDILKRFAGLHFFYPVPVSRIIEFVSHPDLLIEHKVNVLAWCHQNQIRVLQQNANNAFILNMIVTELAAETIRVALQYGLNKADNLSRSAVFPFGILSMFDAIGINTILQSQYNYMDRNTFIKKDSFANVLSLFEKVISNCQLGSATLLNADHDHPHFISGWGCSDMQRLNFSESQSRDYLACVFINCCLKAVDNHMISLEGLDHALKVVYGASSSLYEEIERMGGDYMFDLLCSACESTSMAYLKPSARLRNNPCNHTNAIGVL